MKKFTLFFFLLSIAQLSNAQEDKYLWLEEVDSEMALEFVEELNRITVEELIAGKDYQEIYDKSLNIYNSTEKIAYPTIQGNYVYNFWKDKDHVRGIWRRSPLELYTNGNPAQEYASDIFSAEIISIWLG